MLQVINESHILVNPYRVECAMRLRKMTVKALAESVGKSPRIVTKWRKPSGYTLYLTEVDITRLADALGFLPGWFTDGDEEEDFANAAALAESMERHWRGE